MSLKKVIKALQQLSGPEVFFGRDNNRNNNECCSENSGTDDSDSDDSGSDNSGNESDKSDKKEDSQRFFCYEDTFTSRDLKIELEDFGQLTFPLDENCIQKMIKISSKAKFGSGEETLLDTNVRDTQQIPADKLKVSINEKALASLLERIGSGLNIDKDCTIEPFLHNLLIYGPGQFFKKHRDSEKLTNMIATLVIVLPSKHTGGDLIIEHNKRVHVFFGSQNSDIVKCVAFYSDCKHEIKKVLEGYRVALTYNVVLKSSSIVDTVAVKESLDIAVANYFSGSKKPNKLIFLLNHCYTEHSLKWYMLKGTDRTNAHALFAVAKKQERIPFLALADYQETKESAVYGDYDNDEVYDSSTDLYYWVDEHNIKTEKSKVDNTFGSGYSVCDDEICYTVETTKLCKAYKTEESGPTGNEGATCEYWYRRACVVILSSKWVFLDGFNAALSKLFQLTTQKGNESQLLKELNTAGDDFKKIKFWQESSNAEKLLKIVIYLKDSEKAVLILSHLGKQLLIDERIEILVQLESLYDVETWAKILQNWKKDNISSSVDFIKKYVDFTKNRIILEFLLHECIEKFLNKRNSDYGYGSMYSRYTYNTVQTNDGPVNETQKKELLTLLKICVDVGYVTGEKKLIQNMKSKYPAVNQSEILFRLFENLDSRYFIKFKEVRDEIMNNVEQELFKLKNINGWSLSIKVNCDCVYCCKVNAFFKSATDTKVLVPAAQKNRAHIYSFLNSFRSKPIKFETLRQGSPFKIVIEKLPSLKQEREKQLESLLIYQKKLKEVTFELVPVKAEDIVKVEPEENMNTEFHDNFENIPPNNIKEENIQTEPDNKVSGNEVPSKRLKIE